MSEESVFPDIGKTSYAVGDGSLSSFGWNENEIKTGDIYRFDTVEDFLDVMTGDLDVEEIEKHRLTSNSDFPEESPILE